MPAPKCPSVLLGQGLNLGCKHGKAMQYPNELFASPNLIFIRFTIDLLVDFLYQ